jgi:hypothetical protein
LHHIRVAQIFAVSENEKANKVRAKNDWNANSCRTDELLAGTKFAAGQFCLLLRNFALCNFLPVPTHFKFETKKKSQHLLFTFLLFFDCLLNLGE